MFEKDFKYSKINLMSTEDTFEPQIKPFLHEHYKQIKNIYMHLVSYSSTYPTMSFEDVTDFARRSKLFSQDFNVAGLEQAFRLTI